MDPQGASQGSSETEPTIYPIYVNIPPGRAIFLPYELVNSNWQPVRGLCIDYLHPLSCILLAKYAKGLLVVNLDYLVPQSLLDSSLRSFGEILSLKIYFGSKCDNPEAVQINFTPSEGVEKKILGKKIAYFQLDLIKEHDRVNISVSLLNHREQMDIRVIRHPNEERISAVRYLENYLKLGGTTEVERLVIFDGLFWYSIPENELVPRFETEMQEARFQVFQDNSTNITKLGFALKQVSSLYDKQKEKMFKNGFFSEMSMVYQMMICLFSFDTERCLRRNFISTLEYLSVLGERYKNLCYENLRPSSYKKVIIYDLEEPFDVCEICMEFFQGKRVPHDRKILSRYLNLLDFYLLRLQGAKQFDDFKSRANMFFDLLKVIISEMLKGKDVTDEIVKIYQDTEYDLHLSCFLYKHSNEQWCDQRGYIEKGKKKFNEYLESAREEFSERNYDVAALKFRECLYYAVYFGYMSDRRIGDVLRYNIFTAMANQDSRKVNEYFTFYLKFYGAIDNFSEQIIQEDSLTLLLPRADILSDDRPQINEIFTTFMRSQKRVSALQARIRK